VTQRRWQAHALLHTRHSLSRCRARTCADRRADAPALRSRRLPAVSGVRAHLSSQSHSLINTRMPGRLAGRGQQRQQQQQHVRMCAALLSPAQRAAVARPMHCTRDAPSLHARARARTHSAHSHGVPLHEQLGPLLEQVVARPGQQPPHRQLLRGRVCACVVRVCVWVCARTSPVAVVVRGRRRCRDAAAQACGILLPNGRSWHNRHAPGRWRHSARPRRPPSCHQTAAPGLRCGGTTGMQHAVLCVGCGQASDSAVRALPERARLRAAA
jgi:hypothetical protein